MVTYHGKCGTGIVVLCRGTPMKGGQLRPGPGKISTNERSCCITSHQSNDGTKTKGSCLLVQYLSWLFEIELDA